MNNGKIVNGGKGFPTVDHRQGGQDGKDERNPKMVKDGGTGFPTVDHRQGGQDGKDERKPKMVKGGGTGFPPVGHPRDGLNGLDKSNGGEKDIENILAKIKRLEGTIDKATDNILAIKESVDLSTIEQKLDDLQKLWLDIRESVGRDIMPAFNGHFDEQLTKLDEKIDGIDETARDISSSFNQQTQAVQNLAETLRNLDNSTQKIICVPGQLEQVYGQLGNLSNAIDESETVTQSLHRQTKEDISTDVQKVFVQFRNEVSQGIEELRTLLGTMESRGGEAAKTRIQAIQGRFDDLAKSFDIAIETQKSWNGRFGNLEQNISNKVKTTLDESVPKVINNAQIAGGVANAVNATIAQAIQSAISSECNKFIVKMEEMKKQVGEEITKKVDSVRSNMDNLRGRINTDVSDQILALKKKNRENANYLLFTLVFSLVCGLNAFLLVMGQNAWTTGLPSVFLAAFIFVALSVVSIILFGLLRALDEDFHEKRIRWYYFCTSLVSATAFVLSMISFWG